MARAAATLSHRDRIAWTFASGLVSALEGRLLPQRATLELLNAGGLDDLLARVRQTAMFADLSDARGPFELAEEMQACAAAAFRMLAVATQNEVKPAEDKKPKQTEVRGLPNGTISVGCLEDLYKDRPRHQARI